MKSRMKDSMIAFIAVLAFSSSAYAGCTNAQFAGTWDVAFSDGNACRLVVNAAGEVLIAPDRSLSTCFDPFRGVTTPDEGEYAVGKDCSVTFNLVVEGLNVEIYGQLAQPRTIGAGIFVSYIPDVFAAKGSANFVRVE